VQGTWRQPWEGLAVPCGERLIVEVNGLPSVEALYHYPALIEQPALQGKLRILEDALLDRASLVVTPSEVTREYLVDRGVRRGDIAVVPNAPSIAPAPAPVDVGAREGPVRLCYVGTLAPWQGVEGLVAALPRVPADVALTVLTPSSPARQRALLRHAAELGVADRVTLAPPLPPEALGPFLATQDLGAAPLTPCARNLVQGGMPLKVLDYLAAGLPVLAPDLPIVAELLGAGYPTYPRHSARGMAELLAELVASADRRRALGAEGLARVASRFGREAQAEALCAAYRRIAA
jgi:glycosyltransferase involved in cell wall biosynthesis